MGIVSKPEANYTPARGDYKTLEPFRYWCQKVLPLVYDDSLSYYELLCKVVDYLNKTMEDVGTLNGDISNMYTAFKQLQDYVNNYFSTLDVQEEINNKLDEMAKSGYLSSIIAPIVLNVAVPLFVDNVSDMTDHSRIYVLTSTGFVYLWNGTAWYNTGMNYTDNFTQYLLISGTLSNGTDANDITTNGIWNINGSFTYKNLPITSGLLQTFNMSNVTYQLATSGSDTNRGKTLFRRHTDNGWSPWTEYDMHPNGIDTKAILESSDLNNVTSNGIYAISSSNSYTNCPISSGWLFITNNEGVINQFGIHYDTDTIYFRHKTKNNWNTWNEIPIHDIIRMRGILPSCDMHDLVNNTDNGIYFISSSNSYKNLPIKTGMVFVQNDAGITYQILFTSPNAEKPYIALKWHTDDGWSDWKQIYTNPESYSNVFDYGRGVKRIGKDIHINSFESGYYNSLNGKLENASTYIRSRTLFKVKEHCGYYIDDESSDSRQIIYYDSNYNFIGYAYLNAFYKRNPVYPVVAPSGAIYAGLNYYIGEGTAPTKVIIHEVDGSTLSNIGNNIANCHSYYGIANGVINNNGTFSASDNYKCLFIPNPKCNKIFLNYNALHNCFCIDSANNIVTPTDFVQVTPTGRIYNIPNDAVLIGLNYYVGESNKCYATLIYEKTYDNIIKCEPIVPVSRIAGKNIACIGDSITYIDGRNYGGQPRLIGYPSYLRMLGATVQDYGYSGYAYCKSSESDGIANSIVNNNLEMSSYDIAILFGGSNDIRLNTALGDENTDYASPIIGDDTVTGAIGKLVNYLRKQNPKIEIFICTVPPSQATSKSYNKTVQYNDTIKKTANFWNIPVIDIFNKIGVHPTQNFETFFYDNTHPNALGCERIGKIIAGYINNYMSIGLQAY